MCPTDSPQHCSIRPTNPKDKKTSIAKVFSQENLEALYPSLSAAELGVNDDVIIASTKTTDTPVVAVLHYRAKTEKTLWLPAISVKPDATPEEVKSAFKVILSELKQQNPNYAIECCVATSNTHPLNQTVRAILTSYGWKVLFETIKLVRPAPINHGIATEPSDIQRTNELRVNVKTTRSLIAKDIEKVQNDACTIYTDPTTLPFYGCSKEQVIQYPYHPDRTTLVYYDNQDRPVGALTFSPRTPNRTHIELAGVPQQYRNHGIASALFKRATLIIYKDNPSAEIEINTFKSNDNVLRASKKAGFVSQNERVKMRKSLSQSTSPLPELQLPPPATLTEPQPPIQPILAGSQHK